MPFARVGEIEIYHEVHGAGERVVLLSGTGGDLRTNPRRGHGRLEEAFEVLMYDHRGLGQSAKPDVAYTMADYAEDCVGLMDALGWERAHLVGVSFGGMVAQHVAIDHPERVDRLVLACTSSGGAGGASFDLLSVADLPPEERTATVLPILDTRNDPSAEPPVLAPMFDRIVANMAAGPRNGAEPGSAVGARRQLQARAGHDAWDDLHRITAPTLVMGGRFDGQAPMENLERLTGRIPGAELAMFDGGHMFLLQEPSAWESAVAFLGSFGSA